MNGKILAIAGSDPSGGAGIQADIKTISAHGGYGMAAITALTVQDTNRVYEVHPVAPDVVAAQVKTVIEDIMPDAIKLGMMGSAETLRLLSSIFADYNHIPLIVDPVILSSSGHQLLEKTAVEILISDILPLTDLLTPNLAEAALLAGMDNIHTVPHMIRAAENLLTMGAKAVVVKGGHLPGDIVTDVLVTGGDIYQFSSPLIATGNTHGTGCAFSSAIATGIGQGMNLREAVDRAHKYVHKAILQAPGFGHGKGPLKHFVALD
ncbi:MAG: bifunctional hydroxymethylpyrimidine kinase/phosphomethylpyrimidine kinase [Alphaproteobacteria bacterium]|nr:MAG: bifunctional hydroxymethylpyrimidine kinase/phosphomethylpyrimidine kinase [Alphaproteobacteria bacterium]